MAAIRGRIEALFGQGAPGSEPGISEPLTDSIYVDVVSGKRYVNTGTAESPTWVEIGAGGGGVDGTAIAPLSAQFVPDVDFTVRAIALDAVSFADTAYTPSGSEGPGHTLTATANGALICDGVTMAVDDRVGFLGSAASGGSNQNRRNHGVYVVTATGDASNPWVLTRATDFDDQADLASKRIYLHATEGTNYGPSSAVKFYMDFSAISTITFGTTRFDFKDFTGTDYPRVTSTSAQFVGAFTVNGGRGAGGVPVAASLETGTRFIDEGTATLSAGAVTVASSNAFTGMQVLTQRQSLGSAPGHVIAQNVVDGVSFDLVSSSGTDDGDIFWTILH